MVKEGFIAEGTTCESCSKIIKKQALKVKGVKSVTFDYSTETGYVTFDDKKTDIDTILSKIEEKNYVCYILEESAETSSNKTMGWIFATIGILIVGYFFFKFIDTIQIPSITQNMGYGLLFVVGLLTGFHCISMCGGFVISYTAKDAQEGKKSHNSHLMYGLGKTISYTIIGAAFGLLGSIIAFTPMIRGVVGLFAGAFLILFGLKMLNIFPVLRKIQFRTPKFISKFVGVKSKEASSPLTIGLLNGLMIACGPLQAIYVMAAGTGSAIEGGKLLLVFGLGTLPALLGFGYFASVISAKATHKILKASGVLVIILGVVMLNNGLVLTGTGYDVGSMFISVTTASGLDSVTGNTVSGSALKIEDGYQIIEMEVNRYGWEPEKFVLKKGVPVKWIINGKEINGCNNAIQVPKLGLNFDIKRGEQIIEFTPTQEGIIPFSCWMGMIPGTFIVKDDVDLDNVVQVQKELDAVEVPAGGSCGGGSGCGCGGGR
jgi:sulfite exporter TauE/SafE/copper chaperone CopZ